MRQFTIQRVMFITLFALIFIIGMRIPVDTDTWWHIRSGEHTLSEGMIHEDPFSHSLRGEPWINHSWGSQIILYGAWQIAGNAGLALYTAILATAGMALLYPLCAGNVYVRAFALVLGALTAAVFWSARPQMMSFTLSALVLLILYRYKRQQTNHLWLLPPVMLVWGNLHAGFSIGFIFMGGVIAGEILGNLFKRGDSLSDSLLPPRGVRKLIVVALVSVAALVVNPYGLEMLRVPFDTVGIGVLRQYIQEWNSPNFQERQTWPFILMLVSLLGLVGASRKSWDWSDFVLVSGTLFMALLYGRNIAVFAVAATPVLARHADAALSVRGWAFQPATRVTPRLARLNQILAGVVVLATLAYTLYVIEPERVDAAQREHLPVQVAEFIAAERPPGPMFNSYNWGGYLMLALPDYPVYVDGRTDLYRDAFLTRYLRAALGLDGWRETLDEDGINLVVVETGSGLARALGTEPGWTRIYPTDAYPDESAVIYRRENSRDPNDG